MYRPVNVLAAWSKRSWVGQYSEGEGHSFSDNFVLSNTRLLAQNVILFPNNN